jgi:hypothetical protein
MTSDLKLYCELNYFQEHQRECNTPMLPSTVDLFLGEATNAFPTLPGGRRAR